MRSLCTPLTMTFLLGLAACGDDGVGETGDGTTTGTDTAATETTQTATTPTITETSPTTVTETATTGPGTTTTGAGTETGGADTTTGPATDGTTGVATGTTGVATGTTGVATGTTGGTTGGAADCPDEDVGSDLGPHNISTVGQMDDFTGPCGGAGGEDYVFLWTAPAAGSYQISTEGSNFDTVLYALDGCGGAPLACNDDAVDLQSVIQIAAEQDQEIAIVVDGFDELSSGDAVLQITATDCMEQDIGNTVPLQQMGNTAAEGDDTAGSCGGLGAPDESLIWTAPAAGLYEFDLAGSTYDTVLHINEGMVCGGTEIGCNDDTLSTTQSYLVADLMADESVVINVDGFDAGGDYTLSINELATEGDCCDATANATPTCEDNGTTECVCNIISECCTSDWDQLCVGLNNAFCEGACPLTPGGTCCDANATPGCDTQDIEECVCAFDSFCCNTQWDASCADAAVQFCAADCP